jgi:hypothetical protein
MPEGNLSLLSFLLCLPLLPIFLPVIFRFQIYFGRRIVGFLGKAGKRRRISPQTCHLLLVVAPDLAYPCKNSINAGLPVWGAFWNNSLLEINIWDEFK